MQYMAIPAGLPDFAIRARGELSRLFLERQVGTWHQALNHVQGLPYARNRNRAEVRLVLQEARGTCSSKHALLAALAAEQKQPVQLMIGIYEMTEANTPGIGRFLSTHKLTALPEAHCYLQQAGARIDVTFVRGHGPSVLDNLLHEEPIQPAQVDQYKPELHRRFLDEWRSNQDPPLALDLDELWSIREQCIAALSAQEEI